MSLAIQSQTPNGQSFPFEEEELTPAQRAILDRVLALSIEESDSKIQKTEMRLSAKYRKLIPNMKMTKSSQKCTVCYSQFCEGEIIKQFPCKHIFHRECSKSWMKISRNCPNCRLDLQQHFQQEQKMGKLKKNGGQSSKQNKITKQTLV